MNITVLGSTGSIGKQTVDVCKRLQIRPRYLTAHKNTEVLATQIDEFLPEAVCVADKTSAEQLRTRVKHLKQKSPRILFGESGLLEIASVKVDRVVVAITGFAALKPVHSAILAGNSLALANKECLVIAGDLLLNLARERGIPVYPVDSEHSAIWQCLAAAPEKSCSKIYLTASGGPFRATPIEAMTNITPKDALNHPVWSMGTKITIDSATMFNKALELIEAMHLFGLPEDKIEILVHPDGIVHSMVEFHDGAILAQLGVPDMRVPIQLALTWPERINTQLPRFNFFSDKTKRSLIFEAPDDTRFPALSLARKAAREGKEIPLVMNAANEIAVDYFLENKLSFLGISHVVAKVMDYFQSHLRLTDLSLDGMIKHDSKVRAWTIDYLSRIDNKI